jgi:hypothetical protein
MSQDLQPSDPWINAQKFNGGIMQSLAHSLIVALRHARLVVYFTLQVYALMLFITSHAFAQFDPNHTKDSYNKAREKYKYRNCNEVSETEVREYDRLIDCDKKCLLDLHKDTVIKVKVSKKVSSGFSRKGDYVEFTVADDVTAYVEGLHKSVTLISKDTRAFGRVVDQRGRIFLLGLAKLRVALEEIKAVNGEPIRVEIDTRYHDKPKKYEMEVKEDGKQTGKIKFVAGRKSRPSIPTSLLASAVAASVAFANGNGDEAAALLLASSLMQAALNNAGVSEIVNGSDVQLDDGLIIDVRVLGKEQVIIDLKSLQDVKKTTKD